MREGSLDLGKLLGPGWQVLGHSQPSRHSAAHGQRCGELPGRGGVVTCVSTRPFVSRRPIASKGASCSSSPPGDRRQPPPHRSGRAVRLEFVPSR
eukprot:SAG11_NODE_12557_length_697_cov_1.118729_1_plen_94_part_10